MNTDNNNEHVQHVILQLPSNYVISPIFTSSSPFVIACLLDCVVVLFEMIANTLPETDQEHNRMTALLSQHHSEKTEIIETYNKHLLEQKKQLLEERNEFIDSVLTKSNSTVTQRTTEEMERLRYEVHTKSILLEQTHQAHIQENSRVQQLYETLLNDKNTMITTLGTKIDTICSIIESLKLSNSAKGSFGENCVRSTLQTLFPSAEINDVSHIPHNGDLMMFYDNMTLMIEIKTKTYTTKEDLLKFEKDIKTHKNECNAALFVTSSCGIPNKGDFALEFVHDIPVIYIAQILETSYNLKICTQVLYSIVQVLHDKNTNVDREELMQHFSNSVSVCTSITDTIKQNTKVLNVISQNALEQKQINEEKLQMALLELTRINEKYFTKTKTTKRKYTTRAFKNK